MTSKRIIAGLAAVTSIVALAGCAKTVDAGDLEGQLTDQFAKGQDGVSADCPDDEKAEKGNEFTCTLKDDKSGETLDVKVTMTDDDGHFSAVPDTGGG